MPTEEYRKIATIKAEKFDGSDEMIKRYDMDSFMLIDLGENYCRTKELPLTKDGKRQAYIHTLEGNSQVIEGDYIATEISGEHYAVKPNIFEKTYEKVKDEYNE